MMGDFNAKIGSDNRRYGETMGQHGLGEMNANGNRFANLHALNSLFTGEAGGGGGGGECLPAQKDTLGNLGITRPVNREPDRPFIHRKKVKKV